MGVPSCAIGFFERAFARLAEYERGGAGAKAWVIEALELIVARLAGGHLAEYQATVLVAARRGAAHGLTDPPLELAVALHDAILAAADETSESDPMAAPAFTLPREIDLSPLAPAEPARAGGDGQDGEGPPAAEGEASRTGAPRRRGKRS